jgi:hypothetical protein
MMNIAWQERRLEKILLVCSKCIQILMMIAHNMAFATRDRPLFSRQCGSSVEMGFAI